MQTESNIMQVAMNRDGVVGRRGFLRQTIHGNNNAKKGRRISKDEKVRNTEDYGKTVKCVTTSNKW